MNSIRKNLALLRRSRTDCTPEIVREARRLLADGMTREQVAKRVGVSAKTVSRIATGEAWGWVK